MTARGVLRPMIVRRASDAGRLRPKPDLSCRLRSEACRLFERPSCVQRSGFASKELGISGEGAVVSESGRGETDMHFHAGQ